MKYFIRLFGLPGSWKWACRQMKKGHMIRPRSASGTIKFKLDDEGQGRILWSFARYPTERADWDSANIFLSDFEATDWERVGK